MKQIYKKIKLKISEDIDFKEILKGASFSLVARILAIAIGMIINIIIARYYGADIMGLLAIVNSFLALSLIFSLMGTHVSILRFLPEHIAKYSYSSAQNIYIKMTKIISLSSIVFFMFIYIFVDYIAEFIFHKSYLAPLLVLASVFIIVQSLMTLNTRALRALKALEIFALFQLLPSVFNLIILLIMTFVFYHVHNPIYSQFITYFIIMVLLLYIVNKIFKKQEIANQNNLELTYQDILKVSFPMFLSSGMTVIIAQSDIIMLSTMVSEKEVGIYAIAAKLALLTAFINAAINTISAPKFAELFHSNKNATLEKIAKKTSKLIFLSTLPISVFLIVFGEYFLSFFGDEFIEAYNALVFLTIGQLFNASVGLVGSFLNMTGHEKVFRNIVLFGGSLNILLNYFLIPIYGIEGAAIASMSSIIIWNLLALWFIYKKFGFFIGYVPFLVKNKGKIIK